jgi:hypothetical protein
MRPRAFIDCTDGHDIVVTNNNGDDVFQSEHSDDSTDVTSFICFNPDVYNTDFTLQDGDFTINLSTHTLTPLEKTLLDKGLTFILTQKLLPSAQLLLLQHRLIRQIKLQDFFEKKNLMTMQDLREYLFNIRQLGYHLTEKYRLQHTNLLQIL